MADEKDVLIEKRPDGVALITLNRPASLNAMGGELMPLLAQYLDGCSRDRAVRAVVLTGAGRAFCAGGDVKGMARRSDPIGNGESAASDAETPMSVIAALDAGVRELRASQAATSYVLHTMPKPTIAMVNGHAVGAGLSLALACDMRIASEKAKFGTAFRNVGFSGDFGGSWYLQRLVGYGKARELYLTGEIIDAGEAHRLGMANRVVPHDDLLGETLAVASRIASGPALAFARMKENFNLGSHVDLKTLLDHEALNMRLTGMTNDFREAAQAFVEKREPKFAGM